MAREEHSELVIASDTPGWSYGALVLAVTAQGGLRAETAFSLKLCAPGRPAVNRAEVLLGASARARKAVSGLAGTERAGGDYGTGAGGDTSHAVDIAAERAVLDYLRERSFGCTVLGEECGRVAIPGEPGGNVVMDAVDGSVNAVRGIPFYCCSLAYAEGDTLSSVTDAVIEDMGGTDRFWASRGRGAIANGSPMRAGAAHGPEYRVIVVNVSGISAEGAARVQPVMEASHTRHFGANALEMAHVARGWLDALVDVRARIRVQDIAAGCLLVREAGGAVVDDKLGELDSDLSYEARLSFVAAANRTVLAEIAGKMGIA